MGTGFDDLVERELRKRYPEYTGVPWQHPEYPKIRNEITDYLDDVWNHEAWETAEGERFHADWPLIEGG